MADWLQYLPSVLILGLVVASFLSLQRRHLSPRVWYWLIGWTLMFLHFLVLILGGDATPHLKTFLEMDTLQLAAVAFLVSVLDRSPLFRVLEAGFAGAVSGYSALLAWDVSSRWPYVVCLGTFFLAGPAWAVLRHRLRRPTPVVVLAVALFGVGMIHGVIGGHLEAGYYGLLLAMYAVTGLLFARRYPRASLGVVNTCGGFGAWAAVCGIRIAVPGWVRGFAWAGVWDVPQFIVAFSMLLVLLEEESHAAQAAKSQLQRFAEVTSNLLSGVEVKPYCKQIAQIIAEATTFSRAIILLAGEDQCLSLAGQAGLDEAEEQRVRQGLNRFTVGWAEGLCRRGRLLGGGATLLDSRELEPYALVRSARQYAPNAHWQTGSEVAVPLRTPGGSFIGLIVLDDPRDPEQVKATEMAKIEMLAADIAVAVDNAALHRQLVMTEKLAGIGQLIRGVAHELNNPLTAVLGYAELLTDRPADPELRRGLDVIFREGKRMRSILGNLLRFAQPEAFERRNLDVLSLLQELLRQKKLEVQARGIELSAKLASALPLVAADEAQMKQVLLNVLNNALDAVENAAEKRVTVMARAEDHCIILSVLDTGPGFSDPSRIFDPFFTTKSPGKGVGLGLSICYGIVKQHGGTISARNVHPNGACVTIELPAARLARIGAGEAAEKAPGNPGGLPADVRLE
jgi:signal transduction histidine kinase